MKTIRLLMTLILFLGLCPSVIAQDTYFYTYTQQPLWKLDSIITVKFDIGSIQHDYSTFANSIEALDETKGPEYYYGGFDVYYVEEGYNTDSLINELSGRSDVIYTYPTYRDSTGMIFKLNNLLVLKYLDTLSQNVIDSVETVNSLNQVGVTNQAIGMKTLEYGGDSNNNVLAICNGLFESGLVEYAHPDFAIFIKDDLVPNDPYFYYQYNLKNEGQTQGTSGIDIEASKAWQINQGENTIIAIIDDGFIWNHEDLDIDPSSLVWDAGYDFAGDWFKYNLPPDDDPSPGDKQYHGVACSGIIKAKTNNSIGISGVSSRVHILPLKCWDNVDVAGGVSVFANAITYAVDRGAEIICGSWHSPPHIIPPEIYQAILYAYNTSRICVFSSGNYHPDEGYKPIGFPANLDITIAVGAIDKNGDFWNYSAHGLEQDLVAPTGHYAVGDIFTLDQPGILGLNPEIQTCLLTNDDYICTFGGTSAAAPQVAGIVAMILSKDMAYGGLDNIKYILSNSARDQIGDQYDTPGFDEYYGYGLVSAYRALLAISRGDVNNDGTIDVLDIMYLIDYKFKDPPGPEPIPEKSMGDVNCDGVVNVQDIIFLINHKFKGGPAPGVCFNYDMLD